MRFEPKTEKEISEGGLLSIGPYDFEVADATDKVSNSGNDMIELKLLVFDTDGRGRTIFDYLVSTEGAAYKVRHFAYSIGMGDDYEKGELTANSLIGATGKAKVFIKKDKNGQYPDKNAIADYLPPPVKNGIAQSPAQARVELDDDIPF